MGIKNEIIESYKNGGALTKLIYINAAVFLLTMLVEVFFTLMNFRAAELWLQYIMLPANVLQFFKQPWTIVSFMFVHDRLITFLFNILLLYWSGKLFLSYFNQKQLTGMYLLGGVLGGIFFIILANLFPYFDNADSLFLSGAAAPALAILMAVTAYNPNMELRLMFIGKIRLKYIAAVFVCLSLFSIVDKNAGYYLGNIGGLLAGYLFSIRIKQGKDITKSISLILDFFVNLTSRRKRKFKSPQTKRTMSDSEWNAKKKQENDELDAILDKIKQHGYSSLTAEEKKQLFEKSK